MVTEDPPKDAATKDASAPAASAVTSANASGKQLNSAKACPRSATAAAEACSQGGSRATSTALAADIVLPVEQSDTLDVAQELLLLRSDMAAHGLKLLLMPSQIRNEMAGMKDVQTKLAVALDALVNQLQDGGLAAEALTA
eukprot:6241892-Prymnesium_polylepis.1